MLCHAKVDRVHDETTLICKNLFKPGTDMNMFLGMGVRLGEGGPVGRIDSTFGKSKFKCTPRLEHAPWLCRVLRASPWLCRGMSLQVHLPHMGAPSLYGRCTFSAEDVERAGGLASACKGARLYLQYKRFVFDDEKKMVQ
jgi:hypothetical protein